MNGLFVLRHWRVKTSCAVGLFLLLWLLALAAPAGAQQGPTNFEHDRIILRTNAGQEYTFDVELALTTQQLSQGLMFRPSLAREAGMLFIHRPARRVDMWMRNTRIPLDMLFVAANGEIVRIEERTVPFSQANISSRSAGPVVLEVNGGTVARLGIRSGDRVLHPAFDSGP